MDKLNVARLLGAVSAGAMIAFAATTQAMEVDEAELERMIDEKVKEATASNAKITTKGKLAIEDPDGDWEWRIGGRIMVDGAHYWHDGDLDFESGSEFRRARLYVSGKLWNAWKMKLQYDFTNSGSEGIRDAYIQYTGFKPTSFTVGNFKEPFSLEELTSSKYITFMERAMPNVFAPGRAIGAGVHTTFNDMFTGAAGFFSEAPEDEGQDEGFGITGRVTFSPVHTDAQVVHLGAAGSWRKTDGGDSLRLRQRPDSHVTSIRLVDAGSFDVDDFLRVGVEGAAVYGPFHVQGEYLHLDASRNIATNQDVGFGGWYAEAGYFLTGESRPYKFEKGAFDNLKPRSVVGQGGIGAWQVAARYSDLDLSDEDIDGGEEKNITVGLNWYPTANMRLMANYVNVLDLDGGPFAAAGADDLNVIQVRAQVHW